MSTAGGGKAEPVSTKTVLGEESGIGLWPACSAGFQLQLCLRWAGEWAGHAFFLSSFPTMHL